MALYRFKCPTHGDFELFQSMDHCNDGKCPKCNSRGKRMFDNPHVYIDFTPGWQPAFGRHVETKKELDTLAREAGAVRLKD